MPIKFRPSTGPDKNATDFKCLLPGGVSKNVLKVVKLEKPTCGLSFTGTQWINTGVYASSNIRVVIDAVMTVRSADTAIFGARTSAGTNVFCLWAYTGSSGGNANSQFINNTIGSGALSIPRTIAPFNQRLLFDKNRNITFVNNEHVGTTINGTFTTSLPIYLGAVNTNGTVNISSNWFYGTVYSCQIYYNDVLVRNFIPVAQGNTEFISTPAPANCFYDSVTKQYFQNQGTGSFNMVGECPAVSQGCTLTQQQLEQLALQSAPNYSSSYIWQPYGPIIDISPGGQCEFILAGNGATQEVHVSPHPGCELLIRYTDNTYYSARLTCTNSGVQQTLPDVANRINADIIDKNGNNLLWSAQITTVTTVGRVASCTCMSAGSGSGSGSGSSPSSIPSYDPSGSGSGLCQPDYNSKPSDYYNSCAAPGELLEVKYLWDYSRCQWMASTNYRNNCQPGYTWAGSPTCACVPSGGSGSGSGDSSGSSYDSGSSYYSGCLQGPKPNQTSCGQYIWYGEPICMWRLHPFYCPSGYTQQPYPDCRCIYTGDSGSGSSYGSSYSSGYDSGSYGSTGSTGSTGSYGYGSSSSSSDDSGSDDSGSEDSSSGS